MKISIQGSEGSFNEEATLKYIQENSIENVEIDYALSSENVLKKIHDGESDLGVFALYNSGSGAVRESVIAMGKFEFEIEDVFEMEVKQCLHVKPGVTIEKIRRVISHTQAIKQSKYYLSRYLPRAEILEGKDTAFEVQKLMNGDYDDVVTAVLASRICSQKFGSKILVKDIQNEENNVTTFCVVRKQ